MTGAHTEYGHTLRLPLVSLIYGAVLLQDRFYYFVSISSYNFGSCYHRILIFARGNS